MNKAFSNKYLKLMLAFISILVYTNLTYNLHRQQFYLLIVSLSFLFSSYWIFLNLSTRLSLGLGVMFRLVFLLGLPMLSQDFYRFIWDGQVLLHHINPYSFTPEKLKMLSFPNSKLLLEKMGELSRNNFSNYPPGNQLFFFLVAKVFGQSLIGMVIIFRILIILSDIGIFWLLKKTLKKQNLSIKLANIYFLNPLIIIELTGNLHFEGLMILFLSLGIYCLQNKKNVAAAICIGISILIKLLPLLVVPLLWPYLRKPWHFFSVLSITVLVGFLPFADTSFIAHYSTTVGLWFSKFEFNASFYYFFREIGFRILGYNPISFLGKLAPLVLALYTFFALKSNPKTNLLQTLKMFNLGLCLYFFFSTTIHPWYLATLIFLSSFVQSNAVLLWSFTIFISYSAYSIGYFKERPLWLLVEYIPVFMIFYWEEIRNSKI